jgi:CDP-diacylglycerol--serine O-phosphatidyltransferase
VQYDSLSDLVAFGVAPGIMAYLWALKDFKQFGWAAAFLFVVCGALRLARFNVQQGSFDPRYFNGLPIPAAAVMVAASVAFYHELGRNGSETRFILGMMYVLSFLAVTISYISFNVELFRRHSLRYPGGTGLFVGPAPSLMGSLRRLYSSPGHRHAMAIAGPIRR